MKSFRQFILEDEANLLFGVESDPAKQRQELLNTLPPNVRNMTTLKGADIETIKIFKQKWEAAQKAKETAEKNKKTDSTKKEISDLQAKKDLADAAKKAQDQATGVTPAPGTPPIPAAPYTPATPPPPPPRETPPTPGTPGTPPTPGTPGIVNTNKDLDPQKAKDLPPTLNAGPSGLDKLPPDIRDAGSGKTPKEKEMYARSHAQGARPDPTLQVGLRKYLSSVGDVKGDPFGNIPSAEKVALQTGALGRAGFDDANVAARIVQYGPMFNLDRIRSQLGGLRGIDPLAGAKELGIIQAAADFDPRAAAFRYGTGSGG